MSSLILFFLFSSIPADSIIDSICIRVLNKNIDTLEMNSVDPAELQAFIKLKNDALWILASVQWHISKDLGKFIAIPAPVSSAYYLLDLTSNEVENGFVWISIAGFNKTDTLFVHVHQCSLKNIILHSKLCIDYRNISKIANLQGKCVNKENIARQLILYNKKKIINTR